MDHGFKLNVLYRTLLGVGWYKSMGWARVCETLIRMARG